MKDFPLDQLLSATELEKIKDALIGIFGHLKKIKLSQYPVQRCLRLIEAISKDLMSQLLKVLSTKKLMLMNYEDFEKVCFLTFFKSIVSTVLLKKYISYYLLFTLFLSLLR